MLAGVVLLVLAVCCLVGAHMLAQDIISGVRQWRAARQRDHDPRTTHDDAL